MGSTRPATTGLCRAKRNAYRLPDRSAATGAPVPIVYDVPLPNGLLAMRVAVTRLTDMPGWSKVETWDGAGCGLSPHDFDERERRAAGQVMRAALVIALHLLPPGDIAPLHGSFRVSPLPDRLADLTALAMVDALTASIASHLRRIGLTGESGQPEVPTPPPVGVLDDVQPWPPRRAVDQPLTAWIPAEAAGCAGASKVVTLDQDGCRAHVAVLAGGGHPPRGSADMLTVYDRLMVPLSDDLAMWIEDAVVPRRPVNHAAMHVAARFGPDTFTDSVTGSVLFSGAAGSGLSEARLGWLLGQLVRDGVRIQDRSASVVSLPSSDPAAVPGSESRP